MSNTALRRGARPDCGRALPSDEPAVHGTGQVSRGCDRRSSPDRRSDAGCCTSDPIAVSALNRWPTGWTATAVVLSVLLVYNFWEELSGALGDEDDPPDN